MDKKIDDVIRAKIDSRKRRRKHPSEDRATVGGVLDARTFKTLHGMLNKGLLSEIVGVISAGKEATVLLGKHPEKGEVAIKVYKVDTHTSKWMKEYLRGDYRFKKTGRSIDKTIFAWTLKEYKNLTRAYQNGIPAPEPIHSRNNILTMQFLGENGSPAPRLKDVKNLPEPQVRFEEALDILTGLLHKCRLVHGDYSEYNLLFHAGKVYMIDISQGVPTSHPKWRALLVRDLKNLFNYFRGWDIDLPDVEDTYYSLVEPFD